MFQFARGTGLTGSCAVEAIKRRGLDLIVVRDRLGHDKSWRGNVSFFEEGQDVGRCLSEYLPVADPCQ